MTVTHSKLKKNEYRMFSEYYGLLNIEEKIASKTKTLELSFPEAGTQRINQRKFVAMIGMNLGLVV